LNLEQKRALRAADIATFVAEYGRKAQRGREPNDRRYSCWLEELVQRMRPEDIGSLLRDDES
jgi:hypothetical protein